VERTQRAGRLALGAAAWYGLVAAAWILLSDVVLDALLGLQVEGAGDALKGLAFVAVTTLLLYMVLRRYNDRLLALSDQLEHQMEVDARLFRSSPVGMFVYDAITLQILEVNEWLVAATGRSRDELRSMLVSDLVPNQDKSLIERVARSLGPVGEPQVWFHLDVDGAHRWLEVVSHQIDLDGRAARLAVVRDVTAQLMAEEALRASERRLASVLSSMQEIAFSIDLRERRITYLNDVALEVLGVPASDLLMTIDEFMELVVPEDRAAVGSAFDDVVAVGWAEREISVTGRDGTERRLRVRGSAVVDDDGRVVQIDGVAVDLTHRHELERLVQHQRSFDQLTGLPVRSAFLAAVEASLAVAPDASPPGVVAMFDLDRFGDVNESAGHEAGDQVLIAVAQRLSAVMEPGMVSGRVGGDEFAVFCPPGMVSSSDIGSRLRVAVEGLFLAEGYEFFVGLSVGLAEAERGE
jgi:diguanylate cyclase (GGDEF)-like protein/PAS domain S-box-containing protein